MIGVASIRWVRPDFTTSANSTAFASSEVASASSPGSSSPLTACIAAMWIEEGNTSLEDCEAFTWSLGCTGRPSRRLARVATTSLVFMFDEVPEPVWKTSMGNWLSCPPAITSSAAATIAPATSASITPSSALASAAARLIWARAAMWCDESPRPEIGKFSTARWVWAA